MNNHATSRIEAWRYAQSLPVGDRIGPAPPQLVEYINLDNIVNGFPERPHPAKLDPHFLADVKGAVADVPTEVWSLFRERLLGVYFVEKLGGTGYTEYVSDQSGWPVAAYIVLDAAVLASQSANSWATWKENTPFKSAAAYRLEARIEPDSGDNRRNAIQYILLHELGHVLSVGNNVHPQWNIQPRDVEAGARYPFFDLSWKVNRRSNRYQSLFDAHFPQRTKTAYYLGAKLRAADMVSTYVNLENTNFPTLYAATRPGDDFAESFASYVHVVMMKRPWQITISKNGVEALVVKPCWGTPRCAEKEELLRRLLKPK